LNAFTTKEETCIYASFPAEYLERAMELLADIILNSSLPEKELKKEKEIVLDEIRSYKDSPSEDIFDAAEEYMFKGHPLAHNILGKPSSVKKFHRDDVANFIKRNYLPTNMVLAFSGNTEEKKVIYLAEKYFGHSIDKKNKPIIRKAFTQYKPYQKRILNGTHQSHCVMSTLGYDIKHHGKTGLLMLANLLGGPGMNSLLNLSLREKYAFCYHVESSYTPLSDTGIFSIYLATDKSSADRSIELASKEMNKLRENKISSSRMAAMKKQIAGQIMLSQQNESSVLLGFGKSILLYNKVDSLEETLRKINRVTAEELQKISREIFDPKKYPCWFTKQKTTDENYKSTGRRIRCSTYNG
jgi:predicted Zn-dependent peptidase